MFGTQQAAIAVLGYHHPLDEDFVDLVKTIDAVLHGVDAPRRDISYPTDCTAIVDHLGVRAAIGLLPHDEDDTTSHLVIAIGTAPAPWPDDDLSQSHVELADRVVTHLKDAVPFDTIIRGETPETVDATLILALFEVLLQLDPEAAAPPPANANTKPARSTQATTPPPMPAPPKPRRTRTKSKRVKTRSAECFDEILAPEPQAPAANIPQWIEGRATPTEPLRLTIHTMALSVMLYAAPLGAFLFTYSLLRDVSEA